MGLSIDSPDDYLDGSPLDRNIFLILILIGMALLWRRRIGWNKVLRANPWLFLLILYGGLSVVWSDFPLVSFKRWFKGIGAIVMALIVVTDSEPVEAIKALFRRTAFVLIPLSVLFIKYYPELGRVYNIWSWLPTYTGVTMNKNSLGFICLAFGIFFFWNILNIWRSRRIYLDRKEFVVQIIILIMIAWLTWMANSVTSLMCLILGMFVLLKMRKISKNNPNYISSIISVFVIITVIIIILEYEPKHILFSFVGRDLTLTGRTELWNILLDMNSNQLFGTGYESFWLGKRAAILWERYWWHPNQAHNGYLEIYLNLGVAGVFFLGGAIVSSYRSIRQTLTFDSEYGCLRMTFLVVVVFYNLTEAAFKGMHFFWFVFLLIALGPDIAPVLPGSKNIERI
jgi:hypothetical protein